MFTDKIKELEAGKARVAALEKSIASQLSHELAALPGKYGFANVKAFIKAVKSASGGVRRGPGRPPGSVRKRRRARITDETRAKVGALVAEGKTGAAIAKQLKISLPTVQNIKKALGLVKARK